MKPYNKYYLFAGEIFASREPYLVTTVLGSCVSVCLWDSRLKIGGINHFTTPSWNGKSAPTNRFGDVAIGNLIKKMTAMGSRKSDLKAKVFGGGKVIDLQSEFLNVGEGNIRIAENKLKAENIPVISSVVGDVYGRKLIFDTHDGTVLIKRINAIPARLAVKTPAA